MKKLLLILLTLGFLQSTSIAQQSLQIAIVSHEEEPGSDSFMLQIQNEMEALLASRYELNFETVTIQENFATPTSSFKQVYQDSTTDMVVGVGVRGCSALLSMGAFSKPTILTIILDKTLQNVPDNADGTSGIPNLTYVQSPFNISRDFQTLHEIIPYDKLAIFGNNIITNSPLDFNAYFERLLAPVRASHELITLKGSAVEVLADVPEDIEAAYFLPPFGTLSDAETQILLDSLAARNIPVFSLFSDPLLQLGAFAAYDSGGNLDRIPRRVAINALKITEGSKPEDLPVAMDNFTENLVVNMKVAKRCGVYPSWDILAKAILMNVAEVSSDRSLTLRTSIAEGLKNNLEIKIAEKETARTSKDVDIAKGNVLPTLDASATFLFLDDNSVINSFGTRGRYNITANGSLTQIIFSENAFANIAIQKLLLESQEQNQRQVQLDIIQDVADAYLNVLQSITLVSIRNQNVSVTQKNYDIAQAKEQLGYSGTNDVYRFQSELALDNVDLNNAQAQLRQARFALNALLNLPIKEDIKLNDVEIADSVLLVMDDRLFPLINNPGDLEIFADFLVAEAFNNLPEIKQLELATAATERNLRAQNRSFYLPTIGLSSEYEYPVDNFSFPESVMQREIKPTFNLGVSASLPIFQGNIRRNQRDQTQIDILQLDDQLADIRNKLELQVRGNLEVAGASYSNVELSRIAADAAEKNFEIAQNSYQQGLLNVTSLIDAQNAFLQAQINATNAEYTFISDFIAVERAFGYYNFIALPEEQEAFFQRFVQFITQR